MPLLVLVHLQYPLEQFLETRAILHPHLVQYRPVLAQRLPEGEK